MTLKAMHQVDFSIVNEQPNFHLRFLGKSVFVRIRDIFFETSGPNRDFFVSYYYMPTSFTEPLKLDIVKNFIHQKYLSLKEHQK